MKYLINPEIQIRKVLAFGIKANVLLELQFIMKMAVEDTKQG
jgi:hypothetical protein